MTTTLIAACVDVLSVVSVPGALLCSSCDCLLSPHNNPIREDSLTALTVKGGKRDSEKLGNLPKVTQQMDGRARV